MAPTVAATTAAAAAAAAATAGRRRKRDEAAVDALADLMVSMGVGVAQCDKRRRVLTGSDPAAPGTPSRSARAEPEACGAPGPAGAKRCAERAECAAAGGKRRRAGRMAELRDGRERGLSPCGRARLAPLPLPPVSPRSRGSMMAIPTTTTA